MGKQYPYVVVEGATSLPRTRWRAVINMKPDSNGVMRETRAIELADESDKDAMGVQRWKPLNMKSGMSDWILVCEAALDLALQESK